MKNIVSWGSGGCAYREGERVSLCRDWEVVKPAPKGGNGLKITCVNCLKIIEAMNDDNELVQCELKVEGGELVFTSLGHMMRLAKFYTERDAQFTADLLKLLEGKLK